MRVPSKRCLLLLGMLVAASPAAAQFNSTAQSAREGALGGVVLFDSAVRSLSAHWQQGWLQEGLASRGLRLQWPLGALGSLGAAYEHQGNADYHTQQLRAAYALRVSEWLRVGVAARYLHLGTSDAHYAPQRWLAASALAQARLGRSTLTLVGGTRPWDRQSPWRLHLQVAYRSTARWLALVEWEHEEADRLRMGVEYAPLEPLRLRIGMATRPTVLTFGTGVRWGALAVDLAAQVHAALGLTPQISLALWF